jgi:hypothetical protein
MLPWLLVLWLRMVGLLDLLRFLSWLLLFVCAWVRPWLILWRLWWLWACLLLGVILTSVPEVSHHDNGLVSVLASSNYRVEKMSIVWVSAEIR